MLTMVRNIGFLLFTICSIIYWWKMFERAGIEGWYSLIPIVNCWKICEVIYGAGWKMFVLLIVFAVFPLIPFGGILSLIVVALLPYRICQAYGKDDGLSVLITYIPIICSIAFMFIGLAAYYQIPLLGTLIYQFIYFDKYKGPVSDVL